MAPSEVTCHHEFDECVRGVWLTPLAFWPFTQRKDFQMDGRSVNIKREERSLAWRSHSSSCDHVIMSDVYWNYVPHYSLGSVWMIFSFNVCVCVFDSVWLYFQYVSEWFDSVFSVSTLSIPLHKLVKTVAFFTVLNEKKHKISYSEFKRNISNLINPFREKANFQATSLSSFCKFAEQSFNVILSKTCTPCLSHAQSVSSIQRCQWAEKWPLLSLMLLHHGITSGWAPARIFTGLLLISLSARFRGHIDFYTALSQGRAEDSRQHNPSVQMFILHEEAVFTLLPAAYRFGSLRACLSVYFNNFTNWMSVSVCFVMVGKLRTFKCAAHYHPRCFERVLW